MQCLDAYKFSLTKSIRFHQGLLGFRVETRKYCENLAKRLSARRFAQGFAHESDFCFLASRRIKTAGRLKFHHLDMTSDYR